MVCYKMGGKYGVHFTGVFTIFSILGLMLPAEVSTQQSLLLPAEVSSQNNDGDIRLRGINSTSTQGRVEVYYRGRWGTVCDDGFDKSEAVVVCRQLGASDPSNGIEVLDGRFGPGTGDILIDSINCQATEQRLTDCPFGGWNVSDCTHAEDVGVICPPSSVTPRPTITPAPTEAPVIPGTGNCTQPDENIRVIGPSNLDGVGVVQIRRNGVWGGVCDNGWDLSDAKVVCRMLCFDVDKALPGGPAFDTSVVTEPMTVDNVACTGNERSITECGQSAWTEGICQRSEMAKVTCVDLNNAPPGRPEPLLDCTNGLLSSSFARSRDEFLDEKHLSVALTYTGPCNVVKTKDDDYVTIQIPFDECGTQRSSNSTHIIYKSIIRYLPTSSTGDVSNANTYMVHVQCELPRDVVADKPIQPLTETVTQVAPGEFLVNMHFYRNGSVLGRNNSFKVPVSDFPLQLPLGEWLNAALELTDVDKNLKLVVPNCYATPTADKNDPIRYPLFTDKCTDDKTVGFFPLNNTWFGYRYQTFKFVQYSEVYIHCDAYVCEHDDPNPQCDRSCFETSTSAAAPGTRRKRSSFRAPQHVYVSSGMMIVYDPIPSNEIIRPDQKTSTARPSTESSSNHSTQSPAVITKAPSTSSKTTSQSQTVSNHVTSVPSKMSSQSQTVSDHVTQKTSHATNHLENGYTKNWIEEKFIVGSGSRSMFKPCFVVVLVSFCLHFIRL